uniref:Uncharacterized protein n=1 Tax=Escherichia coli TaxID=562 RepID=A0A811ASS1_ECOLX|nr:hypothetical protein [Escherichia coli]
MTQRDVLWVWKHGDVSSERAIVRTRNISCLKDGKTIDMPIKGHVSFRGKTVSRAKW